VNPQPAQTPDIGAIILTALPGAVASYAGRNYFGGFGGALLGYAIYSVFIKPTLFPKVDGTAPI
jgi:hypothetical protein